MNSEDDIMDPSMLCFENDFDSQVMDLLSHVRLTADEVHSLRHLFADLEDALQTLAPGLQVKPFGSIVTGLGIKTSDVDCYIELPQHIKPSTKYVIHARNILRKRFRIFTNLFAITTAKVPIVKFLHIPTNCKCDVNFKSPAGVLNSQLVGHLLHMDSSDRALKLAILIKYWSKVHKITGTNLLASYALTIMVIFYLQLMNILPPICELQKYVPPYMVDNWNMIFDINFNTNITNNDSLYSLMGGFFKCFGHLNYAENIVSPYLGRLLNKKAFKNLNDLPIQFEQYKQNIFRNICKPLNTDSFICIQDPFEHSRNCSGAVYPKLAMKIKAHFQFAAKKFDELPPEDFLKTILTEDPTRMIPYFKQKPKHVSQNKVMKHKHNPQQRKHYLPQNIPIHVSGQLISNLNKQIPAPPQHIPPPLPPQQIPPPQLMLALPQQIPIPPLIPVPLQRIIAHPQRTQASLQPIPVPPQLLPTPPQQILAPAQQMPAPSQKIPVLPEQIPDTPQQIPAPPQKIPDTSQQVPDPTQSIPDPPLFTTQPPLHRTDPVQQTPNPNSVRYRQRIKYKKRVPENKFSFIRCYEKLNVKQKSKNKLAKLKR